MRLSAAIREQCAGIDRGALETWLGQGDSCRHKNGRCYQILLIRLPKMNAAIGMEGENEAV